MAFGCRCWRGRELERGSGEPCGSQKAHYAAKQNEEGHSVPRSCQGDRYPPASGPIRAGCVHQVRRVRSPPSLRDAGKLEPREHPELTHQKFLKVGDATGSRATCQR